MTVREVNGVFTGGVPPAHQSADPTGPGRCRAPALADVNPGRLLSSAQQSRRFAVGQHPPDPFRSFAAPSSRPSSGRGSCRTPPSTQPRHESVEKRSTRPESRTFGPSSRRRRPPIGCSPPHCGLPRRRPCAEARCADSAGQRSTFAAARFTSAKPSPPSLAAGSRRTRRRTTPSRLDRSRDRRSTPRSSRLDERQRGGRRSRARPPGVRRQLLRERLNTDAPRHPDRCVRPTDEATRHRRGAASRPPPRPGHCVAHSRRSDQIRVESTRPRQRVDNAERVRPRPGGHRPRSGRSCGEGVLVTT